jgi:hypothetical protein
MDKEIYDFLNDMDISLDRYEKEELSELEKNKFKKDINKRINKEKDKPNSWKKRIIVIAASLILLFGFSRTEIGKNTYVMAGEIFANVKYSIKDGLEFTNDIDRYSSKIGLISESEGVKIKLNDIIVDRDKVYFTLLVDIKEHIPKEYLGDEKIAFILSSGKIGSYKDYEKITMNDKEVKISSSKTTIGGPDSKVENRTLVTEIRNKETRDKGIFDIVIKAENPLEDDMDELENIDFKITFNYLGIEIYQPYRTETKYEEPPLPENIGEFYGEWEFEFTKDMKELSIETDRYKLDKNLVLEELDIELIELTSNPLGNKIKAKVKDRGLYEEEFGTSILLDGYDNLGQRRSFSFILQKEEETIMIKEHYNKIDYPRYREYAGSFFKDANLDFKRIDYIEFTPYYKKSEIGYRGFAGDPIMGYKKIGEPFKLYLNK